MNSRQRFLLQNLSKFDQNLMVNLLGNNNNSAQFKYNLVNKKWGKREPSPYFTILTLFTLNNKPVIMPFQSINQQRSTRLSS